jgi:hypothetical protein
LAQPGKYGFVTLLECYSNYLAEKDKAVNKEFQELLDFLKEMTLSYSAILAMNSDMFPNTLPDGNTTKSEGLDLSAHRLIHLF